MNKMLRRGKKVGIGFAGGLTVLVGLVLVPYPGPGWLIVFSGLAILATEFRFAVRLLASLKVKYSTWSAWLKRQSMLVKIAALLFTGLVVVTTLWLLNSFALIDHFFMLDQEWLRSPFFRN